MSRVDRKNIRSKLTIGCSHKYVQIVNLGYGWIGATSLFEYHLLQRSIGCIDRVWYHWSWFVFQDEHVGKRIASVMW